MFPIAYPFVKGRFQKDYIKSDVVLSYKENVVLCGACIVFSRDFIEKEEYALTPETEFYYEEYILHYRCKMLNYKIVFEPKIMVLHGDGVATRKNAKDEKKRVRFMMKNTLDSAKVYKKLLKARNVKNV